MLRRAASLKMSLEVSTEAARDDEARNSRRASRRPMKNARSGGSGASSCRQSISMKIDADSRGSRSSA